MPCKECGSENPAAQKFCGECGARLAAPVSETTRIAAQRNSLAERRHLTVLFSDLVNSTGIAAQLDPEEWRELARQYQQVATDAVVSFGGRVAQYLGDGLMAYFGYPMAHENDAERAVRAGLAIRDSMVALGERQPNGHPKLSVRVGIHSGATVVADSTLQRPDVFGATPNIAARAQATAEPDTVLITSAVHRLVSGLFVLEERGAHILKGIAEPVELFRVVKPSGVRGRLHAAAATGALTPFVGREDELSMLINRWHRARSGEGQVLLVAGEAGIGKSRLVQEFHQRLSNVPHTWMEAGGAQFLQNTPFYPVADLLQQAIGAGGGESAVERIAGLERALESGGLEPRETVPLVAPILNLPVPGEYPPLLLAPEPQRRKLLAILAAWVFGIARVQPLVLVLEDLHWVDPSTLELQHILVEQGGTVPLLLLCIARPEFRPSWPARPHCAQLTLNRLGGAQVRDMVIQVAARVALARDVIDAVVTRTGGVPLFVEELTRVVMGGGLSMAREIPATLHDPLMARLDGLGPAKDIAQVAAVIGRDFSYELIRAVMPAGYRLEASLDKLVDEELLYVRGHPPEATYQFKHELIRDAAYEALLKSRRKELHHKVARTLAEGFASIAESQPEVLARHWTHAGESDPAIAAWRKAGDAAFVRHAFREADENYRQAHAILSALPESPQRDSREAALMGELVKVLLWTEGPAGARTVEAIARGRALADRTGNLVQLVTQTIASFAAAFVAGDLSIAAAHADQLIDLARRHKGAILSLFGHVDQLIVRSQRGDLAGAEEHFELASAFFDDPGLGDSRGQVAGATAIGALNALALGRADIARERSRKAIAFGREVNSPYDLACAEAFSAGLQLMLGDPAQAEALAEQAIARSERYGILHLAETARIALGAARAQLGRAGEGVTLIRKGLTDLSRIGARMSITANLAMLAQAQALNGSVADALHTVEEALQANPEELLWRPSALMIRGELRLMQGETEPAELDFRNAMELARKMGAKTFELRAAMSLARVLRARGDAAEAHRSWRRFTPASPKDSTPKT